jgi:hypothetical protein
MFQWDSAARATGYFFELSTRESFETSWFSTLTLDTSMWVEYLTDDTWYYWRVTPDFYGQRQATSPINAFRTATITGIETAGEGPAAYGSPNPFAQGTNIILHSDHPGNAKVQITDPLGKKITDIAWQLEAGQNMLQWDGSADDKRQSSSGIYHATIIRQDRPPVVIRLVRTR